MRNRRTVVFIVAIWVVIGLVALEVTARLLEKRSLWEGDVWHWPAPYTMFTHKPGGTATQENRMSPSGGVTTFRFNSEGFREEEIPVPKPAGELRVMLLGSSVVVNGSTPEATIAKHLERMLKERGFAGARVWNCGLTSCVSGQELALLVHRIPRYQPDVILVFDGANDIYSPTIYDPRPGYPYNFMRFEEGFALASEGKWGAGDRLHLLLGGSALARTLISHPVRENPFRDRALEEAVAFTSPEWGKAIIGSYRQNLRKMAAFCFGMGYRGVFVLQPTVFTRGKWLATETVGRGTTSFQRYMNSQTQESREVIRSLQEEMGAAVPGRLHFEDLTHVFDKQAGPIYWDIIHFHDRGNVFVAEALADHLVNEIDLFSGDVSAPRR